MRVLMVKSAIQIFLDINFSDHESFTGLKRKTSIDGDWVRRRIDLFERLTLPSLLNQRYRDFDIWLLCGEKYRDITEAHEWHTRIKVLYDHGKEIVTNLKTDYLAVTRLDSDDLLHRNVMQEIKDNLILTDKRECLVYRENYLWDMINGYIRIKKRRSPAFFTHIFPKKIYRNWLAYANQHFIIHEDAGGRQNGTMELSPFHCVNTFHEDVHQLRRLNLDPHKHFSQKKLDIFKAQPGYVNNEKKIAKILQPFGVDYKGAEQWTA